MARAAKIKVISFTYFFMSTYVLIHKTYTRARVRSVIAYDAHVPWSASIVKHTRLADTRL